MKPTLFRTILILIPVLLAVAVGPGCQPCTTCTHKHTVKMHTVKTAVNKEVTQQLLVVTGTVPDWLKGTFVRNGPTHVAIDDESVPHWFDGLAMIHGFRFNHGNITYSNKFLRSNAYQDVFDHKNLNYLGFDNPPCMSLWQKIKLFFFPGCAPFLANANVNVGKVGDYYIAVTEIPSSINFDLNTMDTLGPLVYQDKLPKRNCFESAHMQIDKHAHEKINYMVNFGLFNSYIVYKIDNDSLQCDPPVLKRKKISKRSVLRPSYMHSFAITKHYVVLVEFPFVINSLSLLFSSKPFIENYHWKPERCTRFLVLDRATGKLIAKIKGEPFFSFHHVNAYEENDNIILDIVTYPDASIIDNIAHLDQDSSVYTSKNLDNLKSKLKRYILSPKEKTVTSQDMFHGFFEFPRINDNHNGYGYRYIYGSDPRPLSKASDVRTIYKIDNQTHQRVEWQGEGIIPGEPIFVPEPLSKAQDQAKQGDDEDRGVILSLVLDLNKKSTFLLILDAKNMTELGRAYTPIAIPIGLHGQFFMLQ